MLDANQLKVRVMKLTNEQRKALREVVNAKLRLWDAASAAENLFPGAVINTCGDALENICVGLDTIEDVVAKVTDKDLLGLLDD